MTITGAKQNTPSKQALLYLLSGQDPGQTDLKNCNKTLYITVAH